MCEVNIGSMLVAAYLDANIAYELNQFPFSRIILALLKNKVSNYLKQKHGCGQNWPDTNHVNGHVDPIGMIGRVEGELLLQVETILVEAHCQGPIAQFPPTAPPSSSSAMRQTQRGYINLWSSWFFFSLNPFQVVQYINNNPLRLYFGPVFVLRISGNPLNPEKQVKILF